MASFLPTVQCFVISFNMSLYYSSNALFAKILGSKLADFLEERSGEFTAKVLWMSLIDYKFVVHGCFLASQT